MKLTTLCYIRNQDKVLMLHRNKKNQDPNLSKWIGIGGKLENEESPIECIRREIYEETGLSVNEIKMRGVITFILPRWENEISFLYETNDFVGEIKECNEGELEWVGIKDVTKLNLWEGDYYFIETLLNSDNWIEIKLVYDKEDKLIKVIK